MRERIFLRKLQAQFLRTGLFVNILITGSVAFDYLMTFPGLFEEQILPERLKSISLSFLVDSMSKQRGGIAPNIAYTIALLGQRPRVMATVGEDFEEYRRWLETTGVDTGLMKVVPGLFTASFFATTDRSSAQIASFYPGAMGEAASQSLKDLKDKPDLVIVSPNSPQAMMKFPAECRELSIKYLYDPSQQVLRLEGRELARDMEGAFFLFCNDYEFGLISKKTGWDLKQMLDHVQIVVITRGKDGADLCTNQEQVHIPTVPEEKIVDPTGVGDAFRGGFLTGYALGLDWKLCGEIGSLAAVYCLEQRGPQGHAYTRPEFVDRFRRHFQDGSRLDILLK